VRLITGDYLDITQADALQDLLDWTGRSAALPAASGGRFEARIVEIASLARESPTFHPKSWRFEGPGWGAAFVGSSNISRAALRDGVEWNLRADRNRDPEAFRQIVDAFEAWWGRALPLDADWIAAYDARARREGRPPPPGEVAAEPLEPPPRPHAVQQEALDALGRDRAEGRRRALVVLATGLGKTWLAAQDVAAWARQEGRWPRVLFLAHREELLAQAARTFRRLLRHVHPGARFAWFAGERSDLQGDMVLASVQKLARPEHLLRLARGAFDYVIVDEVHHGAAPTYRRILDRLDPLFLLGLTATPERADGGDVLGSFDDHVAYRADIGHGIERGLLVPFSYHGLRDDIDYRNIPWRNRRFDPEMLAAAVETERRMARMWDAWETHPGTRTLVFCCSIRHANHAQAWLSARGARALAVHSGEGSADREDALAALQAGALDALCAVDLFNEGVDVPAIDRVVMLRPTESIVVFLQQLGRGLRGAWKGAPHGHRFRWQSSGVPRPGAAPDLPGRPAGAGARLPAAGRRAEPAPGLHRGRGARGEAGPGEAAARCRPPARRASLPRDQGRTRGAAHGRRALPDGS
jgi:superfamily II DNA or RNA helicase